MTLTHYASFSIQKKNLFLWDNLSEQRSQSVNYTYARSLILDFLPTLFLDGENQTESSCWAAAEWAQIHTHALIIKTRQAHSLDWTVERKCISAGSAEMAEVIVINPLYCAGFREEKCRLRIWRTHWICVWKWWQILLSQVFSCCNVPAPSSHIRLFICCSVSSHILQLLIQPRHKSNLEMSSEK